MRGTRPLSNLACLLLIAVFWLTSCTPYKKIPYFQDVPSTDSPQIYQDGVLRSRRPYTDLKIRTGDLLQISIQTLTSASGSSGSDIANPGSFGFSSVDGPASGLTGNGSGSGNVPNYKVDSNGLIQMPLLGTFSVVGLNLTQIKDKVQSAASKFFKDPIVNVRLANFQVTVLGEVGSPGIYIISQDKVSLLDALGLAGDITIFGQRTNVLLAREEGNKVKMVRFDMNSSKVFNSPYFYLKQGDVIYVRPGRGKAASANSGVFSFYTTLLSTISIISVLITRFR